MAKRKAPRGLPPSQRRLRRIEPADILHWITKAARPVILTKRGSDSCIVSTRLVIEALRAFGIAAKPLTVEVRIRNAAFVRLIKDHGALEDTETFRRLEEEYGAWSIGLGFGGDARPGRWSGHLVAIVEGRHLFDLSIDQASRPEHGMHFLPALISCDDDFLAGRCSLPLTTPDGCYLEYQARPDDKSYEECGYRNPMDIRDLVEYIADMVRP